VKLKVIIAAFVTKIFIGVNFAFNKTRNLEEVLISSELQSGVAYGWSKGESVLCDRFKSR